MIFLWPFATCALYCCQAQLQSVDYYSNAQLTADHYYNASWFVSGSTLEGSADGVTWQSGGVAKDSQINVAMTTQVYSTIASVSRVWAPPVFSVPGSPSVLRVTVNGANPSTNTDLLMTVSNSAVYFSFIIPLNGDGSAYNNLIGPQCDSAPVPSNASVQYQTNPLYPALVDQGDKLVDRMGANVSEWQPASNLNAWPIVVELENHPVEDYVLVRLYSAGSDMVQQCGFSAAYTGGSYSFYMGPGDIGQNFTIDDLSVEYWYNDTSAPTTNPTTDPTGFPTENTSAPTDMPSQEPTGVPSEQPSQATAEPTNLPTSQPTSNPNEYPTTDPTEEPTTAESADSDEASDESSDGGLMPTTIYFCAFATALFVMTMIL